METRQILYFLAVVEHGGFNRAAAALQVAQPTLSQSVKALERDLGIELFHRAAHGVVLSAAGRALVGPARQLMRDVTTARAAVGRSDKRVVDMVAASPLAIHPGSFIVGSFCARNPDIQVRMDKPDTDDALPSMVRDGSAELGLTFLPVPRLGLTTIGLGVQEFMLAFPPDAEVPPGPVSLAALTEANLLGVPRGSWQRGVVETALRDAGVRTRLVMELSQGDAIADLVQAGVGATFFAGEVRPDAEARGLQMRSLDPPLMRPWGLVHRPVELSPPSREFVEYARAYSR